MNTLLAIPFTGLGLYNGYRGGGWLKNRIQIFEQFVVPSLSAQSDKNFTLWVQWRYEERENAQVLALHERLRKQFSVVFTYEGVCMWDDKYPDDVARQRLFDSLRRSLPSLFDFTEGAADVYVLLQPSDDCYDKDTVAMVRHSLSTLPIQAISFTQGYLCDYTTKQLKEYNPKTNPPFAAIKYPREIFFDAGKNMNHIALKADSKDGKYPKGTPLPSHEYLPECLNTALIKERGFLVGTHFDNISTVFDHPYAGADVPAEVFTRFGLEKVAPYKPPKSLRKYLFHKMPYGVKRKLRYWAGEKDWPLKTLFAIIYNFLRN